MRDIGLSRLDFLKVAFTASMILWASIVATPASAVTIQYSFTGNITQVNNQLTSAFTLSPNPSAMSGLMTVNTTDTNILDANLGSYTITNFSLNIQGYTATMAPSGTLEKLETGHQGRTSLI